MFDDIRKARSSIHLEYFNFRNDSIARCLFSLLAEKVDQGVKVRAVFDGFGNDSNNQPLQKQHLESLRSQGIDIYEFRPLRFPWLNYMFERDHRKIVVIDGQIAYTGGMNVADYYINGTEQVGEWHDMHCRLTGSVVEELQQIFCLTWQQVCGEEIDPETARPRNDTGADPAATYHQSAADDYPRTIGIINRHPRRTGSVVRSFYTAAIDAARDSIYIINPYFTLTPSVKRALKRALRRGVKLRFMASEKSDIPITPDAALYNAHWLMRHGAEVWIYRPGFHHTKVIMVDGRLCTVGSANLDARSLRFDYEDNAVICDTATTHQLEQIFCRDTLQSFRLTQQSWRQWRTPWQRFRGWFANLLAPVL
ncbi:MAG: cardiolipin synthase [Prevotella sp.]|nr:cardiolipin synthase [Prevotella sp.]